MSTVYIIRHGESEANVDHTIFFRKRNEDVELTHRGRKQISNVRDSLVNQINQIGKESPIAVFTSPFERCIQTAEILVIPWNDYSADGRKVKIHQNFLLSEINCGEQSGTEQFEERPTEKHHYDTLGPWQYAPIRGESLIDVHTRAGLFVVQNNFFQYQPTTIIVSHGSTCLMMHYFLTGDCPQLTDTLQKATEYWPNGLARRYHTSGHPVPFEHTGDFYASDV